MPDIFRIIKDRIAPAGQARAVEAKKEVNNDNRVRQGAQKTFGRRRTPCTSRSMSRSNDV